MPARVDNYLPFPVEHREPGQYGDSGEGGTDLIKDCDWLDRMTLMGVCLIWNGEGGSMMSASFHVLVMPRSTFPNDPTF